LFVSLLYCTLNKIHNPTLHLTIGISLPPTASTRNLGFIFDSNLTFSDQVSAISRACFYFRDLRRIHPVLDFSTAHAIGTSLVHSRLKYCNLLYFYLLKTQLNRLQHIHNSLARAVVAAARSSPVDHILKSLHWLRVPEHIKCKIISTTYKLLQFSSPQYLRDRPTITTFTFYSVTLLRPPVHSRLRITNRSFRHTAPQSGSYLSSPLFSGSNPEPAVNLSHGMFHSRLKTYLFSKSFPPYSSPSPTD